MTRTPFRDLPVFAVAFLLANSGKRSLYHARSRIKNGREILSEVRRHRHQRFSKRERAGRMDKTTGATSDLKHSETEGLVGLKIYAIESVRERKRQ